jgi:sulfur carrier protein ThiS
MKVYLEKEGKEVEAEGSTVQELLESLKINPTTVIVSINENLAITTSKISSKDKIKIYSVVSGG